MPRRIGDAAYRKAFAWYRRCAYFSMKRLVLNGLWKKRCSLQLEACAREEVPFASLGKNHFLGIIFGTLAVPEERNTVAPGSRFGVRQEKSPTVLLVPCGPVERRDLDVVCMPSREGE